MLVAQGKVLWTDSIEKHLPAFKPKDDPGVAQATFDELFRHSAGIDNPVVPWLGPHGKVLIGNEEGFIELLNDSPTHRNGKSLRNEYVYSNIAYGLAVLVIEKIEGAPFAKLVQERILNPLKMTHTAVTVSQTKEHKAKGNLAQSYAMMDDGSWKPLDNEWTDEGMAPVLGMLGIRSSVEDTLIFYSALMDAYDSTASDESKTRLHLNERSTGAFEVLKGIGQNPFKGAQAMLDGAYWQFPCTCNKGAEHSWFHHVPFVRAELPCTRICWSSCNMTMSNHPHNQAPLRVEDILGSSMENGSAYHFNGIGVFGTSAVKFFPKTRSAVVAFASGLNAGDAAEFACLMVFQKMFNLKPERHIISLVEDEIKCRLAEFDKLMADVEAHRGTLQTGADLTDYVGVYSGLGIKILVSLSTDHKSLNLSFEGKREISLALEPYGEDIFSYWPKSRDEWLAGGWLDWDHWDVALLGFRRSPEDGNKVKLATWMWEDTGGPALFKRIAEEVPPPASNALSVQSWCLMM